MSGGHWCFRHDERDNYRPNRDVGPLRNRPGVVPSLVPTRPLRSPYGRPVCLSSPSFLLPSPSPTPRTGSEARRSLREPCWSVAGQGTAGDTGPERPRRASVRGSGGTPSRTEDPPSICLTAYLPVSTTTPRPSVPCPSESDSSPKTPCSPSTTPTGRSWAPRCRPGQGRDVEGSQGPSTRRTPPWEGWVPGPKSVGVSASKEKTLCASVFVGGSLICPVVKPP